MVCLPLLTVTLNKGVEHVLQLCKMLVKLNLEHCVHFWSPHHMKAVIKLEKGEEDSKGCWLDKKAQVVMRDGTGWDSYPWSKRKLRGDLGGFQNSPPHCRQVQNKSKTDWQMERGERF